MKDIFPPPGVASSCSMDLDLIYRVGSSQAEFGFVGDFRISLLFGSVQRSVPCSGWTTSFPKKSEFELGFARFLFIINRCQFRFYKADSSLQTFRIP